MSRLIPSIFAAAVVIAGVTAGAGYATLTAQAADAPGRYSMTQTDDGFIRLDTQTGAMSMCSGKGSEWACKALPDDQKSLQEKIARLEEENRELKAENHRLEDVMGLNPGAPSNGDANPAVPGAPDTPNSGLKLPTPKDIDQAFDYFEGMMKKFRDRMKKLEQDENGGGSVPL